jgi:hypothetical protein
VTRIVAFVLGFVGAAMWVQLMETGRREQPVVLETENFVLRSGVYYGQIKE